ncbi:MAG: replicative DNA helicase [Verrucomicrobiia bacterium]
MIDSFDDIPAEPPDLKKTKRKKAPPREPAMAPLTGVDRSPPNSVEAEQGVLGCVLWSPVDCMGECLEKFAKGSEVFYDLRHSTIFDVLAEMYDSKHAIDIITLRQKLKDSNFLDSIGGVAYLNALQDSVPSPANLSYYIEIIREKHLLRKTIQTCTSVVRQVYEHEGEVDALLDEIEREVLAISEERVEADGVQPIKDLVHGAINTIEHYHSMKGALTGVATGFTDLDKMTMGLHGGEMIVIAARPSMGKTSLAMNIAEYVTLEQKLPCAVFSLEMTSESLVLRMMCSRARVNLRNIREGFLVDRDFPKLTKAAGLLSDSPLYIDDTPGLSILQLRAKARRMHQQFGIKLFVIDYLQLLHSTARKAADNRQQEIADISSGIKSLAKELNVPVIILCQLNRDVEKRGEGAKPKLSDLRESGAIEQDADLVGLLYKPSSGESDEGGAAAEPAPDEGEPINLLIAKQRNGPTGDVRLTFLKGYTRYESRIDIDQNDDPRN